MDNTLRIALARILANELAVARSRHTAAAKRFHLLQESPLGLPNPYGVQALHEVGKQARASLDEYVRALKQFTDFTVERVTQSDPTGKRT
jgi:hypothetical protein